MDNLSSPELGALDERINAVIDEDAAFKKRTSRMLECLFAVKSKVRAPPNPLIRPKDAPRTPPHSPHDTPRMPPKDARTTSEGHHNDVLRMCS